MRLCFSIRRKEAARMLLFLFIGRGVVNRPMYARLCAMFFVILFSSTAFGGAAKVDICHVPPSDPDSRHSITISENALQKHLDHGDNEGPCETPPGDGCPCFTQEDLDTLGATQFCIGDIDV